MMRWLPMGSLPLVLSVTPDTIPASPRYLRAEPARVQKWREHLGPEGFKIGIAWQGNAKMAMDKTRARYLCASSRRSPNCPVYVW
jgi:hypothetical protein